MVRFECADDPNELLRTGRKKFAQIIHACCNSLKVTNILFEDICLKHIFNLVHYVPFDRYVPWNLHEEIKGQFNFQGILDVV